MRILATDGIDRSAVAQLTALGHEVAEQHYEPEELAKEMGSFDALVVRSATKVRRELLENMQGDRLKLIIRGGVGIDNIDAEYARSIGIEVRNTPNSPSNAVAELAVALLFSCARSISVAGSTMREHEWNKKAYSKGFELSGKTAGVIGFGHIGKKFAEKAQALGMNILASCHIHKDESLECETLHYADMETIFRESDVIVLCAPAAEKPFVSAETLAMMKDGVVIINVSRGSNLVEADLLDALKSGKVRAAGLDVWMSEKEPNWELASFPTVSCTPHIGAGTAEAQARIGDEIVEIIREYSSR